MVKFSKLKEKWAFCYTNEQLLNLINEMYELCIYYGHSATKYGIMCVLDKFIDNKKEKIELLMKHSGYNGNLQVVAVKEFVRDTSASEISNFVYKFPNKIKSKDKIIKKDINGETLVDIIKKEMTDIKVLKISDIDKVKNDVKASGKFNDYGEVKESVGIHLKYLNANDVFRYEHKPVLSEVAARNLNNYVPELKVVKDMKTSRAFGKLCNHFKLNEVSNYNKLYAEYCDLVNVLTRKLNFVISLNPLDYLKMSFGVNWASCHTIDIHNKRHMPDSYSGGYCGGTLSYMLDKNSFVTYVVPIEEKNGITSTQRPDRWDRIYRNMFHLQGQQLIQGRIYPQGKDGATDLYKVMRFNMQEALCEMWGIDYIDSGNGNDTWVSRGSTRDNTSWYNTLGCNYQDYRYFQDCNLSKVRNSDNDLPIEIGHEQIDVFCGESFSGYSGKISLGVRRTLLPNMIAERLDYTTYIPN